MIALKVKRGAEWKTWTYERYLREVQLAARGFIHIGMNRHHSVAIIGSNTPEWVICDLAAIFAGYVQFCLPSSIIYRHVHMTFAAVAENCHLNLQTLYKARYNF